MNRAGVKKRKLSKSELWGTLLASPPLIGFLIFGLIPLVFSLYLSVTNMRGYLIEDMSFLGFANMFDNYLSVLGDSTFWHSLGVTFYAALSLPIAIVVSLLLSVLLYQKVFFKRGFRTVFFLPYVCSIVALALMWKTILNKDYGLLNQVLGTKIDWLNNKTYYMPAMIIMGVWMSVGFNIILFSAALTNISPSYYEAARVDGTNAWQRFWHITFPGITPTLFYVFVMGIIGALQEFTRFQAISGDVKGAHPGLTTVFYLYNMAFRGSQDAGMGTAAAVAWLLAILILIITVVNFKVSDKWVSYDQ